MVWCNFCELGLEKWNEVFFQYFQQKKFRCNDGEKLDEFNWILDRFGRKPAAMCPFLGKFKDLVWILTEILWFRLEICTFNAHIVNFKSPEMMI